MRRSSLNGSIKRTNQVIQWRNIFSYQRLKVNSGIGQLICEFHRSTFICRNLGSVIAVVDKIVRIVEMNHLEIVAALGSRVIVTFAGNSKS
ncbi:hypothetical protein SDC9_189739 [bioreactor metagenome]|uniref:Uncharacterized protein n=1 Tax=bioreactor metagenome TaxID=1076179 RepID=A0A645I3Y0_9ZZZZ